MYLFFYTGTKTVSSVSYKPENTEGWLKIICVNSSCYFLLREKLQKSQELKKFRFFFEENRIFLKKSVGFQWQTDY